MHRVVRGAHAVRPGQVHGSAPARPWIDGDGEVAADAFLAERSGVALLVGQEGDQAVQGHAPAGQPVAGIEEGGKGAGASGEGVVANHDDVAEEWPTRSAHHVENPP